MKNILCECVDISVTGTTKKPVLNLLLISESGSEFLKSFQAKTTKKGNITIDRNSEFAKLYRLTIGSNPSKRFSRCNELLKHFIGHEFMVDPDRICTSGIKPKVIMTSNEWAITGHLRRRFK